MFRLIVPIGAVLVGVALLLLGSGLLNTLLAVRGALEGYDDGMLGLIMSGYFLGFFVGTFLALPVIGRVGHIRAFAMCAAIASCSVLLHFLFIDPFVWLALRVVTGAALVILYTIIESWLNGQTSPEQRGRVFAIYMAVNLGSLALAQQLLRLDGAESFLLFAVATMLICISLVPVTWTRFAQPEIHQLERMRFGRLRKIAPVAIAGAFLSGLAMGPFWGLAPVYAGRIGLDSGGVAAFMSCAILGGALFQYPIGRFSDTHDRRRVLAVISAAAVFAAIILWLSSGSQWLTLMAIAIYGGLAFAIYPIAVANLLDHLEAKDILPGGSALLLLHGIGAAVGPALAGQLMALLGAQALPLYFVAMQLLLTFYAVRNMHSLKEEELEHAAPFVPMVRTTPTALEMLPEDVLTDEQQNISDDDAHAATNRSPPH